MLPDTDEAPHDRAPAVKEIDQLYSAVVVAVTTVVQAIVVAVANWWDAGTWSVTIVVAVLTAVGARLMHPAHAVFSGVVAWCLVTGFSENSYATLTANEPDLGRLVALVTMAVVASVWGQHARRLALRAALHAPAATATTSPDLGSSR